MLWNLPVKFASHSLMAQSISATDVVHEGEIVQLVACQKLVARFDTAKGVACKTRSESW